MKDGIEFNGHPEGDGQAIFQHVCKLGHEGIVAKRNDLPYESGRSPRWIKIENPDSPAAKRTEMAAAVNCLIRLCSRFSICS